MTYYEYLIYPFFVATLVAVGCATWKLTQWKPAKPKWVADKRWKNRDAIVNFLFSYVTILATVLTGIAGMVYN